ncbi:MAG TPA: addiction module protein [Hyphomicrobiaceae bacterium]
MSTRAIDIEKLDAEQKLRLIEELWDSLNDDPSQVPLTQAHREELDRRLDEIEEGDDAGIPWDEVLSRIRKRLA